MTPLSTFDALERDDQRHLRQADLAAAKVAAEDARMVANNYAEEWGECSPDISEALEHEADLAEDYYIDLRTWR